MDKIKPEKGTSASVEPRIDLTSAVASTEDGPTVVDLTDQDNYPSMPLPPAYRKKLHLKRKNETPHSYDFTTTGEDLPSLDSRSISRQPPVSGATLAPAVSLPKRSASISPGSVSSDGTQGIVVDDAAENVTFLAGNMMSVVRNFGMSMKTTPRSTYSVYKLKAALGQERKLRFFWEGPRTTKLLVDQEPFAEGGMRCAYKAQVVDGGGMLHDGAMYVLKHHLPAVIDLWSENYEEATESKLCEKVKYTPLTLNLSPQACYFDKCDKSYRN